MCGCLFRTGGSCGTGGSVMDITYPLLIPEDIAQLQAAEKAARDKIRADRIRMLRFLKEGRVAGVSQAAEVLGYHVRTVQRWWQCYREGGLAALLAPPQRRGEGADHAGGLGEFAGGDAGRPHRREAQVYLRDTWHIGIDAISKLAQDQA